MKQQKHAVTVVRDWHPVRRAVAAGAMSVILASAMALPAFAATEVDYAVGDDVVFATEAFDDTANGIAWDGKDAITMNNANVGAIGIEGSATISLQGESNVASIDCEDGDLTLEGNVDVPAEEKPILNFVSEGEYAYSYIDVVAGDECEAEGNLVISGLTINFQGAANAIYAENITIDNSKVAVVDTEKSGLLIEADDNVDVIESVVDLGTGGALMADDKMTIDNSDVSARASEAEKRIMDIFGSPYMAINAEEIELKNEANGEVKYYEVGEMEWAYVDTGDKYAVYLKAASTPGYYTGKQAEAKAMPKTTDSLNPGVFAGMAVLAAGALGALGLSRKNGKHEA